MLAAQDRHHLGRAETPLGRDYGAVLSRGALVGAVQELLEFLQLACGF
jgi:hypothetical protein